METFVLVLAANNKLVCFAGQDGHQAGAVAVLQVTEEK